MPLPPEVVETFPEEIRQDASWQKFDDVGSVAKSYVEMQKFRGNAVSLPDEKAPPEDLEKWRGEHLPKLAARGIIELPPSKVEDYKLPEIEGYTPDAALKDSFLKEALANKMTPKQVEAALRFDAARTKAMKNAVLTADQAEAEYKQFMGDDYEAAKANVDRAMQALSADHPAIIKRASRAWIVEMEDGKPISKAAPFNNHILGKAFYEVFAGLTQEDHSGSGMPAGGGTVDSIESKIREIRSDDKMPGYKKAEALEPLYKQLVELEKRQQKGRAA